MSREEYANSCSMMRSSRLVLSGALAVVFALGVAAWPLVSQAEASASDDCVHVVSSGQTLGHIANRHGVTQRDLIETNRELKKNPDLLRLGQQLDVCAAKERAADREAAKAKTSAAASGKSSPSSKSPRAKRCGSSGQIVEHVVAKGDTLGKITSEYAVTEKEVFRRNPDLAEEPHVLRVGQTVEICVDQRRAKASKLCGFRTPIFEHTVVPGENLGQVAGRYGVRRRDLERWNATVRKNPDLLRVGQTIRVCPEIAPRERSRMIYSVQAGDSFGEIAAKYDLSSRELERYQRGKLADPSSLRVGQELVVWVDGGIVDGFGTNPDDKGVLKAGVQLPPGRHYTVKWEAGAWGTSGTVRSIQGAIASYQRRMPGGPKIHIGDISKRGGGPFKPHSSHQHGRDVDIGYVLEGKDGTERRFRRATADNLDVARTWRLIKSFVDTDEVVYVFVDYKLQKLLYEHAKSRGASEDLLDELFQYPRGKRRAHGIIRHWKGHDDHFHVRFRK